MLVLTLHFFLVSIYCISGPPRSKISFYAFGYVSPFFHQAWNVFVPAPSVNYHLYVLNARGEASDIFQEILLEHQKNRLAGKDFLLLTFVNTIHYFEKNTKQLSPGNGPVCNDRYLGMLEYAAINYVNCRDGSNLKEIKMQLIVQDIVENKTRVYFN